MHHPYFLRNVCKRMVYSPLADDSNRYELVEKKKDYNHEDYNQNWYRIKDCVISIFKRFKCELFTYWTYYSCTGTSWPTKSKSKFERNLIHVWLANYILITNGISSFRWSCMIRATASRYNSWLSFRNLRSITRDRLFSFCSLVPFSSRFFIDFSIAIPIELF